VGCGGTLDVPAPTPVHAVVLQNWLIGPKGKQNFRWFGVGKTVAEGAGRGVGIWTRRV
jgi:hypothetical protein